MVFGPAEAFTPEQLAELYDINVLSTQRVNRAGCIGDSISGSCIDPIFSSRRRPPSQRGNSDSCLVARSSPGNQLHRSRRACPKTKRRPSRAQIPAFDCSHCMGAHSLVSIADSVPLIPVARQIAIGCEKGSPFFAQSQPSVALKCRVDAEIRLRSLRATVRRRSRRLVTHHRHAPGW
jgi:hypothetical protein